jgi:hypothetical protein
MSRIGSPVFTLQAPVLQNNRKLPGGPRNCPGPHWNFPWPAAVSSPRACFGPRFSKNSLFLHWRPVSLDCIRHHPVLGFKASQAISQFVRGNRGFLASGASLNLSLPGDEPAVARLSLRRKFPFPAQGGDRFDDWVAPFLPPNLEIKQTESVRQPASFGVEPYQSRRELAMNDWIAAV